VKYQRKGSYSVHQLTAHIVFATKHRFHVLVVDKQVFCRDEIKIVCDILDVNIIKGVVSKDHIHRHICYPPKLAISDFVKRVKCRSFRKLLQEFPDLQTLLWLAFLGNWFWCMEFWEYYIRNDRRVLGTS